MLAPVLRGYFNGPVRDNLNAARAELIGNGTCPPAPEEPPNLPQGAAAGTAVGGVVVVMGAAFAIVRLEKPDPLAPVLLSSAVPRSLRVSIVVLLVATLVLFIVGMQAHGGAVNLTIETDGHVDAEAPPLCVHQTFPHSKRFFDSFAWK